MKLGLIGTGISRSLTPYLQQQCGRQFGLDISYELFDRPKQHAHNLEAHLRQLQAAGYVGVNVTHPFKEVAFTHLEIADPMIRQIGAINTVRFSDWQGFNTDYSGFIRAYHRVRGTKLPGTVLLIGAGGAGKAVGFALVKLGANQIKVVDTDIPKAQALAEALSQAGTTAKAYPLEQLPALANCDGVVNCTPIGMYQYPGEPIPAHLLGKQAWVFDAIYTPLETKFLRHAKTKGLEIINGAELMFYQALDAFELWTGKTPLEPVLYADIQAKLQEREVAVSV